MIEHLRIFCPRMVRLRGPSAKQFWDGLEKLGSRLEELGIEDGKADK